MWPGPRDLILQLYSACVVPLASQYALGAVGRIFSYLCPLDCWVLWAADFTFVSVLSLNMLDAPGCMILHCTLVFHFRFLVGAVARMILYLSSTFRPVFPSLLWALGRMTSPFSFTCLRPLPRMILHLSYLSPAVSQYALGALGHMVLNLSPACLRLVSSLSLLLCSTDFFLHLSSYLSRIFSEYALGAFVHRV